MATVVRPDGDGKGWAQESGKFVFPGTSFTETITTNLSRVYMAHVVPMAGTYQTAIDGTAAFGGATSLVAYIGSVMDGTSTGNSYGVDSGSGTLTVNRPGTVAEALTYAYRLDGAN